MEARYALRKSPLLAECPVAPEIFEPVMPRLEAVWTRLSGSGLLSAMGPQVLWWSRSSHGAWAPGATGVSRATRRS
jgi:hypothetical protein